jgi:iron complex outermembrane receptor protein
MRLGSGVWPENAATLRIKLKNYQRTPHESRNAFNMKGSSGMREKCGWTHSSGGFAAALIFAVTCNCGDAAIAIAAGSDVESTTAVAQGPSAPGGLEEIVVTAEKRTEHINDVGMSITAATGDQIAEQGITDPSQLAKIVPGFTYQKSTYQVPVYTIRGIGFYDTSQGADPAVSVYVDQVPLPYSIMTKGALLDLERVEVLKGPQGTLFGQNSTGGAINFIAAKPTTTFTAGADLSYGRFNDTILSGFVSGPLSNTLSARLAVSHEGADGWQYSTSRAGDFLGAKNFTNARLLLDWKPSDEVRFELNLNGWQDRGQAEANQFYQFRPNVPNAPGSAYIYDALQGLQQPTSSRAADWYPGVDYARDDKFYQVSLRADWDISDALNLTSITAYSKLTDDDPTDTDGTAFPSDVLIQQVGNLSSASEELRFAGSTKNTHWMVGANYQREIVDQFNSFFLYTTNTIVPTADGLAAITRATETIEQQPTTKSGFASLDYSLTDALTAQISGRYTSQRRKFAGCLGDGGPGTRIPGSPPGIALATFFDGLSEAFTGKNPNIPPFGCVTLDATTFEPGLVQSSLNQNNTSWRGGLNWKLSPSTLLYFNATQGFKSGSYSDISANLSTQFTPVTQEKIQAYEAGIKQALFDRKVEITSAVFYYNYTNKQLVGTADTIFGPGPALINVPKSYVIGAELNVAAQPIQALTINGAITYVKSKVQEDPGAPFQAVDPLGKHISFIGESFPNTPSWMGSLDVVYTLPISDSRDAYVGVSESARTSSYAIFGNVPAFRLPGYGLLDLRAGIKTEDGRWRFEAWARNVASKSYWENVYYSDDVISRTPGEPLTYGISVRYRLQ